MPHKSKYTKTERKGLPGGPNEMFSYVTGMFSTEGYKLDSPDFDNPFNVIKGGNDGTSITMDNVPFSILGMDDLGNSTIMKPGQDYKFPGAKVFEIPLRDTLEYTKKTKDKKNTRFGLSADLKKIKPSFSTILPTQTEIDVKGILPLQYFESVLPFDVKPFNKGNIDIGINQPLSSRTDIGIDFNIPLKGNPNKKMDPLLSLKHRFQLGGSRREKNKRGYDFGQTMLIQGDPNSQDPEYLKELDAWANKLKSSLPSEYKDYTTAQIKDLYDQGKIANTTIIDDELSPAYQLDEVEITPQSNLPYWNQLTNTQKNLILESNKPGAPGPNRNPMLRSALSQGVSGYGLINPETGERNPTYKQSLVDNLVKPAMGVASLPLIATALPQAWALANTNLAGIGGTSIMDALGYYGAYEGGKLL